jgi:hypothetical protein
MRIAFLVLMVASLAGCAQAGAVTREIKEPTRMAEAILGQVPLGTAVDDAQQFMEQEGFKCSRSTNADFGHRQGLDYINCDRAAGDVVQRRWQIALVHKNGKIVEILSNTGLVGP